MLDKHGQYRAKFSSISAQREWFIILEHHTSISEIAALCHCSERTIRDWRRGRFFPDYATIEVLCHRHVLPFPNVKKVPRFVHTKTAGRKGGLATIAKYGKVPIDELTRKAHWKHWWVSQGKKLTKLPIQPLKIRKPRRSEKLAEFIGIMMGDGAVSTYHISITLHASDDKEYSRYVVDLLQNLFGVVPKIYKRRNKDAVAITIARTLLVAYLHKHGLPIGNKTAQGLSIPAWIKKNQKYERACVRGLMDTDGSVFTHRYRSKRKIYAYKKISFSSVSLSLRNDVAAILEKNGVHCCISSTNVRIDSKQSVNQYWKCIGSNNPKHLKRMLS